MINNFNSLKIQKDLEEITGINFSESYINKSYKLIFDNIYNSGKSKFLIAGAQGSGKSTILELIQRNFKDFYNIDPLCLSLDDFYLTKIERYKLSKKIHPLLKTRGVPGTHDIVKILNIIKSFDKKKYPISIPIFDKLNDNRKKNYKKINKIKKIIILEGWCCGSSNIEDSYLKKNFNLVENFDQEYKWRNFYNNKLKYEYKYLFKKFDYLIFVKIPNFNCVLKWRLNQERFLLKLSKKKRKAMGEKEISFFIMHYEKITRWMLKKLDKSASLVVKINYNQRITSVKKYRYI